MINWRCWLGLHKWELAKGLSNMFYNKICLRCKLRVTNKTDYSISGEHKDKRRKL